MTTYSTSSDPLVKTAPSFEASLSDLLKNNPLSIVLIPRPLLIVNAKEDVDNLLNLMRQSSLRCAIIYDYEKLFIGFVDAMDVCCHVLKTINWSNDLSAEKFKNLVWDGQIFATEDAGKLMNISSGNPFESVSPSTPLINIVKLMARGLYRLPVVENGKIVNVVSQWDILVLICSRISLLGCRFDKTIGETGIASKFVISVPENSTMIAALEMLYEYQISGLPVVDFNGRVISNFSATDLLNLSESTFPMLALNVREFLCRIYGFLNPPVVCKKTDTIENVILKMLAFHVHRVHYVDSDGKPIGVVSLTDIMKYLLENGMYLSEELSSSQ